MEKSAKWYESVLGLTRFEDPEKWRSFPIMMNSGTSGIAIFPKKEGADLNYLQNKMQIVFRADLVAFL